MSTDTDTALVHPDAPVSPPAGPVRTQRRLPRLGAPGLFLGGVLVGALLSAATGFSIALTVVYGVLLGTLAVYVTSRAVEGRRTATDRLVTTVVSVAFALAMIPLVSLIYTVLKNGLRRLDATFFNSSMVGIVGGGGEF